MLGVYDFNGHYEWTFAWLEARGGTELLQESWDQAIHLDSQQHASALILQKGIEGMKEYWGHSLAQEGAGYKTTATKSAFRIDIHDCPSKGFLLRNGLQQHSDYCDHCVGWIGPLLKRAGFAIDHQHNHCGQCWWEMRAASDKAPPSTSGELARENDVRLKAGWQPDTQSLDSFTHTTDVNDKTTSNPPKAS